MRFLLFLVVFMFLFPTGSWAECSVRPLTDADIEDPVPYVATFKAVIEKIIPDNFSIKTKPHKGFHLQLKISKVMQGNVKSGDVLTIFYGGCHDLPGKVGDEINVLTFQKKYVGWIAPQIWYRKSELGM
ncbi:MAG: hypothetical protein R3D71_00150 [Rickettsiales bacterium]